MVLHLFPLLLMNNINVFSVVGAAPPAIAGGGGEQYGKNYFVFVIF
jgi:hypothetical protein